MNLFDVPEVAQAIFREAHDALILVDPESLVIVDVNPSAMRLAGIARKELVKLKLTEVVIAEENEDLIAIVRGVQSTSCNSISDRFQFRHADGSLRSVQLTSCRIHIEPKPMGLVIARDISSIRRAEMERQRLNEQMWQAQKYESLGVLAGGVAHDFNNSLTAVLGFTGLALRQLPAQSSAATFIAQAQSAAEKAATLSRLMLAYSGKSALVVHESNLSDIAESIAALGPLFANKAAISVEASPDLPTISADADQLRQVAVILLTNAAEAMQNQPGKIVIRTFSREVSEAELATLPPQVRGSAGAYVVLEVSDDGCGMDAATLARAFDPFFTTKFAGRGLGLSAAQGIVRAHKGFIQAESEVGKGSTFRVFLPATPRSDDVQRRQPPERSASIQALIVEDESAVAEFISQVLRLGGYEPVLALDGEKFVDAYSANLDRFGFAIIDLTLPKIGGHEVYQSIRQHYPRFPIILVSGYSAIGGESVSQNDPYVRFLAKPFMAEDLLSAVKQLLAVP